MEKAREDEKQMSAVVRTISILEALSEMESCNLENLSRKTDLPKATLLRFLSTLTALGYVYRDGADLYHLTLKMFSIGSRSLRHMDLINTAKPFAKHLCQELGETVHMGILEDDSAVYVLKEESIYPLRMYSRVGKVIPLYCTAIGKIFLADMSEKELQEYLDRNQLKPFTAKSIKTPQALRDELERTRQRGWAIDDEEHEENMLCIGAPIKDYSGKTIAAMSVSWPIFRFNNDSFQEITEEIKNTTAELSKVLGFLGPIEQ